MATPPQEHIDVAIGHCDGDQGKQESHEKVKQSIDQLVSVGQERKASSPIGGSLGGSHRAKNQLGGSQAAGRDPEEYSGYRQPARGEEAVSSSRVHHNEIARHSQCGQCKDAG